MAGRVAGRLAELALETGVPGAVLGVWADGRQTLTPYGVLSTRTGVETTADSVFQIGSITKLWTSTLVMQLVDHGTPASTRIYTVAADRDRMTESKAFFSQDGKPILMTIHFTRVP